MSEPSGTPVRIEVAEILIGGTCPVGLVPGQTWEIRDGMLPEGMCASAWGCIQHYVFGLRAGGAMPWNGERAISACCPDPSNPVVFRITAIEE